MRKGKNTYEAPQLSLEELENEAVLCVSSGQIEDSGENGGFVFPNLP